MAATTRKRKRATCYQVFINHRGPDVKNTLASIIYHWLQTKGLRVFLDIGEFQPGQPLTPTIEDAIRTSSVHIAIFSKRYAESDWCLRELCLMLETEATIIPVFYDVRPNDLRRIEKGEYASAFDKHEEKGRFDSRTISAWKSALEKVSYLSGLDLHNPNKFNGDHGQLLRSLEYAVFQNLKPVPLEVATDSVGLDEAIRDFQSFMESEQQNENGKGQVKIVGIVGLGGSGKTTLAKEFFNRESPSFQGSSFLFDLRDASNRNALPRLQTKLLKELLREKDCEDFKIDSISEGKGLIRERLQFLIPRVLIVLDDIDHPSQVEALLARDVLGSGSLIILTSRDEEALKLSEASIYKIKALSPKHAQDLFCKHAFQQPYQMAGFENLVEFFCERCGRLPLFLKVMGAHLRVNANNDKDQWEDELKYIPKDILKILDVSYYALRKEEKQIFLDIACFFLGENKNLAIQVWDTCEGRGFHSLKNLEYKCLVEFDHRNCFKMHDHLRDFGRGIADKESPCRLWNESQTANFREQQKAMKEFRGIMAATPNPHDLPINNLYSCRSSYEPPLGEIELLALKILAIRGDCFDEQIGRRSKNLAWLRWFECPHANISPWLISMKNLTVLEILGGNVRVWPLCDEQVQLRELRIVRTNLSIISIPHNVCPHLEHLDLRYNNRLIQVKHLPQKLIKLNMRGCTNLQQLQVLEHLRQLRELNISHCYELRELPNLQHLLSLEVLHALACAELQHIQGLEHLSQLRELDISECYGLCELPNLDHLPSLERFAAPSCTKLQHVQGLEHLPRLRELDISECYELCELPNLDHLPSLETFAARRCTKLQHIQGLEHLPQLRDLNISHCSELCELPNLQHLFSLETFDASCCTRLQHIQGLERLPQLLDLNISGSSELRKLPKLQHLPSLETVDASNCTKLQHIQGLEHLPQLRDLNISGCYELQALPKLQHLPSLERFKASDCGNLQHIQGLEHLPWLQDLNISGCHELRELPKLQHLPSLETLDASSCTKLQHIQGLEHLPRLRDLNISGCYDLRELPKLQHLPSLERLKASDCANLQHIQGLEHLPRLRDLNISGCYELQELPKLQHLPSLETLDASRCTKLHHIGGLEHLPQLQDLDISKCSELWELPKLQDLPSLETLDASSCTKLQHIQGLERLPRLQDLNISGCYELQELPKLQHLPSLETLKAFDCVNLQHIQGLEHLPRLRDLNISGCYELRELPKLQHLPFLEMLDASRCTKLQHIQGLEHLPQLRDLDISKCSELRELPKLQHLPSLETLDASSCTKLQHIQGLEHLPRLQALNISSCYELQELPKLQYLPSLEILKAFDCASLHHIQGLEHLPQLRQLSIGGCSELQEFPDLARVICLEEVNADGCWKLQGLDQLEKLKSLTLSAANSRVVWNVIKHVKKLPRSMCLSAKAEANSLDTADLAVIDINIVLNVCGAYRLWELPAWTEECCFMICCVVQVSTAEFGPQSFQVTIDWPLVHWKTWETRVEEGEWVCAVIHCDSREHLDLNMARLSTWMEPPNEYEVKKVWMTRGSEAKTLEAVKKIFA